MSELMGPEQIDWENFAVTDPAAPEYEADAADGPDDQDEAAVAAAADEAGRPRHEDGRWLSDDEIAARQPDVEAAAEQPSELDEYVARYGGDRDAALRGAIERERLMGRQASELGDLRQQMQEMLEAVNRPPEPQYLPQPGDYDSAFAQNPAAAVEQALARNDRFGVERLLREWEELDPAQVSIYKMAKVAQVEAEQSRQRAVELEQAQQQQAYGSAMEQAWSRLQREMPQVDQLSEAMREEAAEAARLSGGRAVYSELLKSSDPEAVFHAFRTLALAAMHRVEPAQRERMAELVRSQAAESQRAKDEAIVASASATGAPPPAPKSYDEDLLERFQAIDSSRDGWEIGSY